MSDLAAAEERQGKAYLFYPIGMTMRAVDNVFGEDIDFTMDDVPGLINFTLNAFTFRYDVFSFFYSFSSYTFHHRQQYQEEAHSILASFASTFRSRNPGKFKKKKEVIFVGLHNRRGDHIDFQKEVENCCLIVKLELSGRAENTRTRLLPGSHGDVQTEVQVCHLCDFL